jgi:hypothetical protein
MKYVFLCRLPVAGTLYQPAPKHAQEGDRVQLVPEPENAYDRSALRVEHPRDGLVGYVPRNASTVLLALLKLGYVLRARLCALPRADLGVVVRIGGKRQPASAS